MPKKRLVLIVPSDDDETRPDYRDRYWPNYVMRVRHALEQEKLDCDVRVIEPKPSGEG